MTSRAPCPEQAGQRDVDGGQRGGEISDFAAEQSESGIDVAGKGLQELIDNASAAHVSLLFGLRNGGRSGRQAAPVLRQDKD